MELKHLIDIADVTPEVWDGLYSVCREIIANPADFADACKGKLMASLFFEPSTRTNFSFQAAMMRLGGRVFGFSDQNSTSRTKGETLADTIRMVSSYSDVIVMRSPQEGAAKAASFYSSVPVINAGDGSHMHPTQTLTDLATITAKRGEIGNMNIGLCGDLKNGRTVHSLATALCNFPNVNFYLIAPRDLAMPEYMLNYIRACGHKYIEVTSLESTIPQLDVLYMTRIQKERFIDPLEYERLKGVYVLTRRKLDAAKKDLLILHPLPRVDEIAVDVDDDPRAVYFEQAKYGMYIRMALLTKMCSRPQPPAERPIGEGGEHRCNNPVCITRTEKYLPVLEKEDEGAKTCGYCDKKL